MRMLLGVALAMTVAAPQSRPTAQKAMRELEALIGAFAGEVGVAARHLGTGEELVVNPDVRFPTASVIKTAVMVEAWHRAADGTLPMETPLTLTDADKVGGSGVLNGLSAGLRLRVRDAVHLMIVLSDNTATNLLVNRLGARRINERMSGYGLDATKIFRPTFRDGKADVHPELEREFGLGMSTPREMARLMALIADGRAGGGADASAAMLATLRAQQDRAMIPRLLPAGARTANKTGTDSEKLPDRNGHHGAVRADAAIVTAGEVRYVIAIFVRRAADTRSSVDNDAVILGARLARTVHDHFTAR